MSRMKTIHVDITVRVKMKVPSSLDDDEIQEVISELDVSFEDSTDTVDVSEPEVLESEICGEDDEEDFLDDDDE